MKTLHKIALALAPLVLTACGTVPIDSTISGETAPSVAIECPIVESCQACMETLECPEPEPRIIEKIVEVPVPTPVEATVAGDHHLPIIGAVEWVKVEPAEFSLEARIDSGAETTSIHAENIQLLEKEGKRYVRFTLLNDETGIVAPMEVRLRRTVLIKQHEGEPERRYVVRMWLTLGDIRSRVDVTLSDREVFEFPLLIGRNFLMDAAIVDVSQQHTQPR